VREGGKKEEGEGKREVTFCIRVYGIVTNLPVGGEKRGRKGKGKEGEEKREDNTVVSPPALSFLFWVYLLLRKGKKGRKRRKKGQEETQHFVELQLEKNYCFLQKSRFTIFGYVEGEGEEKREGREKKEDPQSHE